MASISAQFTCGNVDLSVLARRRVLDVEARAVAELNRLPRQRKRAGNQRLRRDHRGHRRQHDERDTAPSAAPADRTARTRSRDARQQHRALAEVVEEQRRQHEREPREADRAGGRSGPCPRRAPRHRCTTRKTEPRTTKPMPAVAPEKPSAVERVERLQHVRVMQRSTAARGRRW